MICSATAQLSVSPGRDIVCMCYGWLPLELSPWADMFSIFSGRVFYATGLLCSKSMGRYVQHLFRMFSMPRAYFVVSPWADMFSIFSGRVFYATGLLCSKSMGCSFFEIEVLLYVHRNRRLIRDGSPGRPPRLSHSS